MSDAGRVLPADPIAFIRERVRAGEVLWTYHVTMRLKGRFLSRQVILEAVDTYEVIEAYPEDKYLPSYLVRAEGQDGAFHVLFAADVLGGNVRVVTAYRPSLAEWGPDLRHRRR